MVCTLNFLRYYRSFLISAPLFESKKEWRRGSALLELSRIGTDLDPVPLFYSSHASSIWDGEPVGQGLPLKGANVSLKLCCLCSL